MSLVERGRRDERKKSTFREDVSLNEYSQGRMSAMESMNNVTVDATKEKTVNCACRSGKNRAPCTTIVSLEVMKFLGCGTYIWNVIQRNLKDTLQSVDEAIRFGGWIASPWRKSRIRQLSAIPFFE